jgi:hypothetical protein
VDDALLAHRTRGWRRVCSPQGATSGGFSKPFRRLAGESPTGGGHEPCLGAQKTGGPGFGEFQTGPPVSEAVAPTAHPDPRRSRHPAEPEHGPRGYARNLVTVHNHHPTPGDQGRFPTCASVAPGTILFIFCNQDPSAEERRVRRSVKKRVGKLRLRGRDSCGQACVAMPLEQSPKYDRSGRSSRRSQLFFESFFRTTSSSTPPERLSRRCDATH